MYSTSQKMHNFEKDVDACMFGTSAHPVKLYFKCLLSDLHIVHIVSRKYVYGVMFIVSTNSSSSSSSRVFKLMLTVFCSCCPSLASYSQCVPCLEEDVPWQHHMAPQHHCPSHASLVGYTCASRSRLCCENFVVYMVGTQDPWCGFRCLQVPVQRCYSFWVHVRLHLVPGICSGCGELPDSGSSASVHRV